MNKSAGKARRSRLAACLAIAAVCAATAGCKTTTKGTADDPFIPFDPFSTRAFNEGDTVLPALPAESDLIPFTVSGVSGSLSFFIDARSVSVGSDGAVRYTVVISSQSGARNVSFEGLRCDAFERKIYATLPVGADKWAMNLSTENDGWQRMASGERNGYASALAKDHFCSGRTVAASAAQMVRDLRQDAPSRSKYQ